MKGDRNAPLDLFSRCGNNERAFGKQLLDVVY